MSVEGIPAKRPVGEIMQGGVATVSPELSLTGFLEWLTGEEISGAPVVDQNGVLRGVVSKTDIVSFLTNDASAVADDVLQSATVEEIMTEDALTVDIAEPIQDVARKMVDGRMHRVIVVEDGQIRGIVTTFDLLKVLV
jgi:predicted transcriptional regulator